MWDFLSPQVLLQFRTAISFVVLRRRAPFRSCDNHVPGWFWDAENVKDVSRGVSCLGNIPQVYNTCDGLLLVVPSRDVDFHAVCLDEDGHYSRFFEPVPKAFQDLRVADRCMVEARRVDEDDATGLVTRIDGGYSRDILGTGEYAMTDGRDVAIYCCVDELA